MPSFDVKQWTEVNLRIRFRLVRTDAICPRVVAPPLRALPDLAQRDSVSALRIASIARSRSRSRLPNFPISSVTLSSPLRPFRAHLGTSVSAGAPEQDLITAESTAMGQILSTSRRAFPALNVGSVRGGDRDGLADLQLLPCRAARAFGVSIRNLAIATLSPVQGCRRWSRQRH